MDLLNTNETMTPMLNPVVSPTVNCDHVDIYNQFARLTRAVRNGWISWHQADLRAPGAAHRKPAGPLPAQLPPASSATDVPDDT